MPRAEISIDMAGEGGLVDARDCQELLDAILSALGHITRSIAKAKESEGGRAPRWKISQARTQSPLRLTLSDESKDLDEAAVEAVRVYIEGIRTLETSEHPIEPPNFFDEASLASTKKAVSVLTKNTTGLIFSSTQFGEVSVTSRTRINIEELTGAKYRAFGVLEGILQTLTIKGGTSFTIFDEYGSYTVKCVIPAAMMEEAKAAFTHRVAVGGLIKYAKNGKPLSIEASEIRILRLSIDLPQPEDIGRTDITGGIESSEYIRRWRDAE
jgi:hypothetical protein